jgi:hypothetical protein
VPTLAHQEIIRQKIIKPLHPPNTPPSQTSNSPRHIYLILPVRNSTVLKVIHKHSRKHTLHNTTSSLKSHPVNIAEPIVQLNLLHVGGKLQKRRPEIRLLERNLLAPTVARELNRATQRQAKQRLDIRNHTSKVETLEIERRGRAVVVVGAQLVGAAQRVDDVVGEDVRAGLGVQACEERGAGDHAHAGVEETFVGAEGVEAADGGAVDEAGGEVVELGWGLVGWRFGVGMCMWWRADLDQVVDGGALLVRSGSCEGSAGDERGDDSGEGLHCCSRVGRNERGINESA